MNIKYLCIYGTNTIQMLGCKITAYLLFLQIFEKYSILISYNRLTRKD